jgi:hypothetical protein
MPRPPRIDLPDAVYHVTSRGNGRAVIFWTDADRTRFLCQLADSLHTFGVVLGASRYAIGDPLFVERTEQRIEGRRTGRAQDEDLALPHWTVPLEHINAAVAGHYGIAVERLQAHGQSAGMAKVAAVELACRLTGLTQRAIGLHYGGITSAAVSTIRRKVREEGYETRPSIEAILPRLMGKRHRRT